MKKGNLYLIPCTLGDSAVADVIPSLVNSVINSTDIYIVEEIKTARRFLKKAGILKPIDDLQFRTLNEHTDLNTVSNYLNEIVDGKNIGLLSEAGCPSVADPGSEIVKLAHKKNIKVIPLVGPSSILLALMASGFNGQNFAFNGYLPKDKTERINKIKELERLANIKKQSQIFIETPYRNMQLLDDLKYICSPATMLCVAVDITLNSEKIITASISDWKNYNSDINKRPTVFIIGT
jgi:16S rRNA (cytidine1402-2'-O)-methyltransferase